jgi:methyl-accepting chemotaxis protein
MSERLSEVLGRWWQRNPNRPATRADLAAAEQRIMRVLERVSGQVSEVDDAVAELNDATNGVADKLDSNTETIQQLLDQLANAEPGSAEADELRGQVTTALDGMRSASSRLRDLAADPENPVPVDESGDDGSLDPTLAEG